MKREIFCSLIGAALLFSSCDNISESDRLIYVQPVQAERSVLVEEFSGQLCVNCPDGAEVLEDLQERLGADTVIVVSFHADRINQGLKPGDEYVGLATDAGGELFDKYGCNSMPSAVFDRKSGVVNDYNIWNTYVSSLLKEPTSLKLSVTPTYSEADNSLDISVIAQLTAAATSNLNGDIHVWLTEDSIVAPQKLKTGGYDFNHVYHNIFRASVNELEGDAITVTTTDATERTYHTALDSSWRADKLNVIVFIDNSEGVCQAARTKAKQE